MRRWKTRDTKERRSSRFASVRPWTAATRTKHKMRDSDVCWPRKFGRSCRLSARSTPPVSAAAVIHWLRPWRDRSSFCLFPLLPPRSCLWCLVSCLCLSFSFLWVVCCDVFVVRSFLLFVRLFFFVVKKKLLGFFKRNNNNKQRQLLTQHTLKLQIKAT